ncbi:MAG: hypothetical protein WBN88_21405 [Anderseniella sp.]
MTAALEMSRRDLAVHIIDDDFAPSPESPVLAMANGQIRRKALKGLAGLDLPVTWR